MAALIKMSRPTRTSLEPPGNLAVRGRRRLGRRDYGDHRNHERFLHLAEITQHFLDRLVAFLSVLAQSLLHNFFKPGRDQLANGPLFQLQPVPLFQLRRKSRR